MKKALCSAVAGFLAAAVFATVALSVSMPFVVGRFNIEAVLLSPILYFPMALAAVLVLGIPTFFALSPFAPGRWWMPLVAGSILGVPLLRVYPGGPSTEMALILVSLSALSALVFWLVWRRFYELQDAC